MWKIGVTSHNPTIAELFSFGLLSSPPVNLKAAEGRRTPRRSRENASRNVTSATPSVRAPERSLGIPRSAFRIPRSENVRRELGQFGTFALLEFDVRRHRFGPEPADDVVET